MKLTKANKTYIDSLRYEDLLRRWRFAPAGDSWFQGQTGAYWSERMEAKKQEPGHVAASKRVGWEKP